LRSYLADPQATVLGDPFRRNPDVIRVTVQTRLEEGAVDAAFVRLIKTFNVTCPGEASEPV
jgi:hypothetical protein